MSRPLTPANPLQARASSALDPVSTSAEVMRQRSSSTSSRDTRARDLLDSSVGERSLATDPKTRKDWAKFTQLVDRTLQSFESVSEWADFITFLGKLLKCLQTYPNFAYIPHKLVVAKRLAQCLNPALPTGVHQRALDVYVHILNAIGYAATSVRPIVLGIYSKFYIPLQDALRPATKAMVLALLPGVEEETGEFFEKVAGILDQLSGTVSPAFFLQNIWLVLITAPSLRIAALNYLARRMPKIGSEDSIATIVGQDVGLMVRGFSAALQDSQILVQRAALDIVAATLRLDGVGFQKDTRLEEQLILMRVMTGVVLRRDLSLSRRLYAWLLGQAEDSEAQVQYFKQHGLELLRRALVLELVEASREYEDLSAKQRPYKVILSLLDKWEISYPLTEVIVSDVLRALDKSSRNGELNEELHTTASMLFDGLDPFLTWRHLFQAARDQITGQQGATVDALDLIAFVIHAFRLSEDEVVKLHAPLVAFGLLDLTKASLPAAKNTEDLLLALNISHALLKETSASFFTATESQDDDAVVEQCGIRIAHDFYAAPDNKSARVPTTGFARRLLANAFITLQDMVLMLATDANSNADLLLAATNLLAFLADQPAKDQPIKLSWRPDEWRMQLVHTVADRHLAFENVEATIHCLLAIHAAPLSPPLSIDHRNTISAIVDSLMHFLAPSQSKYHMQTASLIWAVQDLSKYRHVEATICQRLSSDLDSERLQAFEAFGNLWRYTDDSQLPGVRLSMAMRIMLDALQSDDISIRRAGEAWMRCSLKSYIRILDPLCCLLLDPKVRRKAKKVTFAGQSVDLEEYTHVFDLAQYHHILENLLSLASFGGQGFTRLAKSTYVKFTAYDDLRERAAKAQLLNENYLDLLCKILVNVMLSEPALLLEPAIRPMNTRMHAISADLLQVMVTRGDLDLPTLQAIENALVIRLHLLIEKSDYDLQNKLLHVLHSTVVAIAGHQKRLERKSVASEKAPRMSLDHPLGAHSSLLMPLLCKGICEQRNSAVIHHWVDFLLMTLQYFRNALHALLFPVIDAISARVQEFVQELQTAYDPAQKGKATSLGVNDADYTILLNALERLFSMALEEAKTAHSSEESADQTDRPQTASDAAGGGFLGYISTALGAADGLSSQSTDLQPKAKSTMSAKLDSFIQLLLSAWNVSAYLDSVCDFDEGTSQGYTAEHVQLRTKKALERLHKTNPTDILEGVVDRWNLEQQRMDAQDRLERQERLFDILDYLSSSAQSVVTMLSDIIHGQYVNDKGKVTPMVPTHHEMIRFEFLEAYINRKEGPVAVQIWSSFLNFSKDFINTPPIHKYRLFPTLRCFTALAEKIATTSALEDRRMRRDLIDNFVKLVDATVQMSGRSGAGLLRPSDASLRTHGKEVDSTAPTTPLEGPGSGKEILDSSVMSEKTTLTSTRPTDSAKELALFLAKRVVPDFRRFSIDNDKLAATCGNIMYYNVSPSFKTRTRSFEVDDAVLELLSELTKVPAALKSWRSQVLEVYNDNRFFYGSPSTAVKWKSIVQALITSDKERFPELISRISSTNHSAANIFVNRELENLSKSISIRRLSYTIYCGEKNRYLTQLPAIQEKVVELLRANVSDLVHSEVYLCLRVLLCRIGNQHLSSFWPIILTELLRLFETLMNDPTAQSTEYFQLILSACKFLDLLLVLQTEEFQIHQWMFITDTVDAAYPPESWTPQATMDRLGEIINQRNDLLGSNGTGPRASISVLNTKNGPLARAGIQTNETHGGDEGFTTTAPLPMSAMPQRASFSGEGDTHLSNGRVAGASESEVDALKASGLPDLPFLSLQKQLIKPLLSSLRQSKITSIIALEPFFSRASLANYEAVYSLGGIDWSAVERGLEADLFEGE